jgi:hypothetical protein
LKLLPKRGKRLAQSNENREKAWNCCLEEGKCLLQGNENSKKA